MNETLIQPEVEEENLELLAQGAEKELENILSGKDFSTQNISVFKDRILVTINSNERESDRPAIQDALNELTPQGKSSKTFDVEVQTITDIMGELMDNPDDPDGPNDYRVKNPAKIRSLIAFCQRFNKEQ